MTVFQNTFDGAANTDVTASNSATYGTAILIVGKTGATVKYQTTGARDAQGMQIISAGGTDKFQIRWDYTGGGQASARFYFTLNALPSQAQDFAIFASGSGQVKIGILSGNTMRLSNRVGATVASASPTLTAGTLYRVEVQIKKGTGAGDGQCAMQVYLGEATGTPWHSASSTATDAGTTDFVQWHFGDNTAGRTINLTVDDWKLDNTTQSPLGPVAVPNVAPTANAGPDQTVDSYATVTLTGSGTDSDGTIASGAWTQTGGGAVTLAGSGLTRTFTTGATVTGETLTFSLTVTDNNGSTSTADTMTVTVRPHVEWLKTVGELVPVRRSL